MDTSNSRALEQTGNQKSKTIPCCCGRIGDCVEPTIINDIMHEQLGIDNAFCGPAYKHEIRDLKERAEAAEYNFGVEHDEVKKLQALMETGLLLLNNGAITTNTVVASKWFKRIASVLKEG